MQPVPENIHNYQILGTLGSGGMGQVFLAFDPGLKRQVALKCLQQNSGHPEAIARFQREARLTASLNHPNIVSIFNWFTANGTDYLVLEYVPGSNMRQWLQKDPSPQQIASVLHQVALGLVFAHGKGIVHRDLKAENILIAKDGQVKISDFGLARKLTYTGGSNPLTKPQAVMGTYRAMSPEQARGCQVDQASDRFSFGVLCYEAFSGTSPFQAENPLATLNRIINRQQPPVFSFNPAIPNPLSQSIDALLHKQPTHRPRLEDGILPQLGKLLPTANQGTGTIDWDAAQTQIRSDQSGPVRKKRWPIPTVEALLMGAIAIVALVFFLGIGNGKAPAGSYIAVFQPQLTGSDGMAGQGMLQANVRISLNRALLGKKGLSVLSPEEIDREPGTELVRVKALAANEYITARLNCRDTTCQLVLTRHSAQEGKVLWNNQIEIPQTMPAVVSRMVRSQVQHAYREFPAKQGTAVIHGDHHTWQAYLQLHLAYAKDRSKTSLPHIVKGLQKLKEEAPQFLDAYLLHIRVALNLFNETQQKADLQQAFAAARAAKRLAPQNPEAYYGELTCALAAKDYELAQQLVTSIESLDPENARLLKYKSQILEARGQPAQALTSLRLAAKRHPSWRILYGLAYMEFRQGKIYAARQTLARLLSRSPHNYFGQALAAQLELISGSLEKAERLYQSLARQSPGVIEYNNLGTARFFLGEYTGAEQAYRHALRFGGDNSYALLGLADVYQISGRHEEAARLYHQVIAGIDMAGGDWQAASVTAQAQAHLNASNRAVTAVNLALKRAPNLSQAAYEAALVYALLGDHASAAYQAERALNLGYQIRWFAMPWFKALRKDNRFPVIEKINRELADLTKLAQLPAGDFPAD